MQRAAHTHGRELTCALNRQHDSTDGGGGGGGGGGDDDDDVVIALFPGGSRGSRRLGSGFAGACDVEGVGLRVDAATCYLYSWRKGKGGGEKRKGRKGRKGEEKSREGGRKESRARKGKEGRKERREEKGGKGGEREGKRAKERG